MLVTEWDRTVAEGITHFAIIQVAELRGGRGGFVSRIDFYRLFLIKRRKLCVVRFRDVLRHGTTGLMALDDEVHEQMFRLDDQSDAKPPVFSSQASLVLIYRPTAWMKD
ncbi:hypothetical protein TNCV_1213601 [Trichonephila clavipes]|nr:hypothetical protein TNCV_1213601 [Trichonephila clavipes]